MELGFQRVEFIMNEGATRVILHKAAKGAPTTQFNPASGNIATVIPGRSESPRHPELAVFDIGRDRINATRIPSPSSLDDPDSPLSRLAEIAPGVLNVGARAAHVPQVGSLMAGLFPRVIDQARRQRGTLTDENIRIAKLEIGLTKDSICYARTGRGDRKFDPPAWTDGVSHSERWQYVIDTLAAVAGDVTVAWNEFVATPEMSALPHVAVVITRRHVEVAWASLSARSLAAFSGNRMWPLALRLLGFDDGAAQYVRRIAEGRRP